MYAAAEYGLEIDKYWLVGVRYANEGLPTLFSTLVDMAVIEADVALAVNESSYIGNSGFADLTDIHTHSQLSLDGGVTLPRKVSKSLRTI
jgi:hypothetical protein